MTRSAFNWWITHAVWQEVARVASPSFAKALAKKSRPSSMKARGMTDLESS